MQIIILLAIIILVERITHKSILEIITPIIKKLWGGIEWVILFLLGMNEPRGSKS